MPRRERVVPTAPGEGMVAIQVPIAEMIEAGIGIEAYLRLARGGRLDLAERTIKFNSSPARVEEYRARGWDIPDGLPDIEGDVTWRREPRRWSLDVLKGRITPTTHYSSVRDGVARIRLQGVALPETVLDNLPGRRLREVVEHDRLTHPDILIVSAETGGPYPPSIGFSEGRPAWTTFTVSVPSIVVPDPAIDTQDFHEREKK